MGVRRWWAILVALQCAALVHAAVASAHYRITSARYRATLHFVVSYSGSGSWQTVYHSEPPNLGGPHDTNDAHDSSTQQWSLRFTQPLTVFRCTRASACVSTHALDRATGTTSATGSIDHTHLDGLYAFDNASESCMVGAATPPRQPLRATVSVRYLPRRKAIALTALSPVDDALTLLPGSCPGQGDPLDGLANNYFTPGFSFGSGYGSDRWFTSARVVIATSVLHRAERITIHLSDTRAGTPPADCGVQQSYEHCATGGSWNGTLELSALRN